MSVKGKVVIITGAAQGIGLACAERFVAEGASVVLADVNEELGERVSSELANNSEHVRFISCNVAERLDVRNLLALTMDAFGGIDVLINAARLVDDVRFLELSEEELEKIMNVNFKGVFLVSQAVAQRMVKQLDEGRAAGTIINLSSQNAQFGSADHVAYASSKGAVEQLTRSMAISLAPYGIRINAIGVGGVNISSMDYFARNQAEKENFIRSTPMGRLAEPSEIAATALFLAGDHASFITGETIFVDGGRRILNGVMDEEE